MKIIIGGVLAAIAMFAWAFVAHSFTDLGMIGYKPIPNEAAVTSAMQANMPESGLYFFPWVDPKAKDMEKQHEEKVKTSPSGILVYAPAGQGKTMDWKMMLGEFLSKLVQCLMVALVIALGGIAAFAMRVVAAAAIGVAASLATNASYHIWFGFPQDYTCAQIIIAFVGYLVAGVVIALIVKPRS